MLHGDRVTLRPARPDDVETRYAWRIDLDTWGATTATPPYPMTLELFREHAETLAKDESVVEFMVEADGVVVGRGTLFGFDNLSRTCEVGVLVGPEHRGKGYGKETLRLLLDFAFTHRNLRRVWLQTLATNTAGLRAYAAVGFVEEGRLREDAWVAGEYVDMVRMGILRREWESRGR